ncbi:MAG: hypothetical protein ACU843_18170 [Gammaproteobacteria bacterium]
MKNYCCALMLLGLIGTSTELAASSPGHHSGHHGGSRIGIGFYFGPSFGYRYYPYSYGYPYYPYYPYYVYPPAVVTVPSQPPVYIERQPKAPGSPAGYWYYCTQPPGYYPYIKECGVEWQPVPAQPRSSP